MIYPSDFKYLSKSRVESRHLSNLKLFSFDRNIVQPYPIKLKYVKSLSGRRSSRKVRNEGVNISKISDVEPESIWERYCNSSTVHGFKYFTDKGLHWSERFTWVCLVLMATIGIVYSTFLIKDEFSSNRLQTVVETTFFPIYEIPFPAVTICNFNRVNADHVQDTLAFFFPNATNETIESFNPFIKIFSSFEYGSFEAIPIQQLNLTSFEHINITDLYLKLTYSCEEMFKEACWWRNKFMSCCSILDRQRTEYGLCFTFNSVINAAGKERKLNDKYYPWHSSSYGEWSGLRTEIYINDTLNVRADDGELPGILISIHDPYEWPTAGSGHFISAGTKASIVIKPTYSYKTSDVKRLSPEDRYCLYPDEAVDNAKYLKLSGLPYLRSNCYTECRKDNMISKCNCALNIFYPDGNYSYCNISDFKCLFDYSSFFNNHKPPNDNFFPKDEPGLYCNCLPQCEYIEYGVEISTIQISTDNPADKTKINLDVHFQQGTMVKYRTTVVFDYMDLIVSFGGITGLFLGFSMLSLAEIGFYLIIALLSAFKQVKIFKFISKFSKQKSHEY